MPNMQNSAKPPVIALLVTGKMADSRRGKKSIRFWKFLWMMSVPIAAIWNPNTRTSVSVFPQKLNGKMRRQVRSITLSRGETVIMCPCKRE